LKALDIIALTFVLLVLSITSLFIGPMPIRNIFDMSYQEHIVMFAARVPRLITIIVSGMGMSICGLIMQSLTRNRFVSPTTAGTMDGARLGVLVSMLVMGSANLFWRTFFAFAFTLLTTLVFIKMLERIKYKNVIFVPLVGIMYGNILASITMFFAYRHDLVQNVSTWLIGDFSGILRGRFEMIYISIPLVILTYIYANKFVIAGMGEDFAKNLGLNYRLTMNIGLCIVSIIASIVLLTVGIIPFLGLIIPNLVSIFWGDNLRKTLPYTAAGGAIFLLVCDIIGRLIIHPFEVPINLTVGIIGGAIFLWLLLRKKTHG